MCSDAPNYDSVASSNAEAAKLAKESADADRKFRGQVYNDLKPNMDRLMNESIASSKQQREMSSLAQERGNQQWQQYQGTFAPMETTMGLDAMGAQYLSPEQQARMLELTRTMGQDPYKTSIGMKVSGGRLDMNERDLAEYDQLRNIKPTEQVTPGRWEGREDYWTTGSGTENAPELVRGDRKWIPERRTSVGGLTPQQQARLAELQKMANSPMKSEEVRNRSEDPAIRQQQIEAQKELVALQRMAEGNALGEEMANAGKIRTAYGKYATDMEALGESTAQSELADAAGLEGSLNARGAARRADVTGFYNKEAAGLTERAKAQAAADEQKGLTRANAAVASAYGDRMRQIQQMGGNPNRFGDLATREADAQAMARVAAGSQVGDSVGRYLREADTQAMGLRTRGEDLGRGYEFEDQNQAFGIKSKALDNARAIRAGSKTQGLNTRIQGDQTAMGMENSAKERINSKFSQMRAGTANFGRGYANTSAGQTSLAGGMAQGAANSMNQGVQGQLPASQFMAGGFAPQMQAAQLQQQGGLGLGALQAQGSGGGSNWMQGLGSIMGGAASMYGAGMFSDKKKKTDIKKMSDEEVLAGLEDAQPNKSWKYKKGTPGVDTSKRNVGPMAQDMQREFPQVSNGEVIDVAGDIGLMHAGLTALNRKVDKLAKKKGSK